MVYLPPQAPGKIDTVDDLRKWIETELRKVSRANAENDVNNSGALSLLAPKDSPALTGNPTAPTPSSSDNDTSIATTAFVQTLHALCVLLAGNQTITGGFKVTPYNNGNISGSFTPDPTLGNYQYGTNHGAITFNAPANDCAIDLLLTNDGSAGAITFSGYTVNSNTGEPFTTTNGHKFVLSIRRINGVSTYLVKALQ